MAKTSETAKKTKRPTAQKRDIQNKKKRLNNKMRLSRMRTAIRAFEKAVAEGESQKTVECLKDVYSLVDKGVKTGLIKKNKANRTKARMTAKAARVTA